jgi:hypothetical protein
MIKIIGIGSIPHTARRHVFKTHLPIKPGPFSKRSSGLLHESQAGKDLGNKHSLFEAGPPRSTFNAWKDSIVWPNFGLTKDFANEFCVDNAFVTEDLARLQQSSCMKDRHMNRGTCTAWTAV